MSHFSARTCGRATALLIAAFGVTSAFAHPGHPDAFGFNDGFTHPFSGIDHLLAMLAVGLWAAQNKRSAQWVLPLAFPVMMVAGALLAFAGVIMPGVETGIAASVALLGLLIAFAIRMPVWASASVVSVFALFHGYAHGSELPHGASTLFYGFGFVAATALLHLSGLIIGITAGRKMATPAARAGGIAIAAVGGYLLSGAF
ncbi:HupE-UreJ family metal transporter [Collimonas arenae]|uniref:HupE-UreJ family metal transporter n=1 Tax=Collimonas arenae TaxID=279058 RepID=A0A0A1F843_9BURK|nr:HupE/UreJ family protein [Collimonas arenae]AIY40888.1 HupE-UreJ family metal transporter [Collimonas arenae]